MRPMEEIKRKVPFFKPLFNSTFGSEITINGVRGTVVFSNSEDGYEHVSFAPFSGRIPKWETMCQLKDMFWEDEEEVYQIMPKKSEYVNIKNNCLHLWRPCNGMTLNDVARMNNEQEKQTTNA